MNTQILAILKRIYLNGIERQDSLSLMGGRTGAALFNSVYIKHMSSLNYETGYGEAIQELAEDSIPYPVTTFCSGQAGINWFFLYLNKIDFLDDEDLRLVCSQDQQLAESALYFISHSNTDFLHGSVGIAHYLIAQKNFDHTSFFTKFFEHLNRLKIRTADNCIIPYLNFETKVLDVNKVNSSLSHGVASVLKLCLECYKKKICENDAKNLAYEIMDFLVSNTNSDVSNGYFSSVITVGERNNSPSRLAWCYGDLSTGFILYQGGRLFSDKKITDFSLSLLKQTTQRKTIDDTHIYDGGICHGSSGVAHIYNKLWHYTEEPLFKDASDFWIARTLEFITNTDKEIYCNKYNPTKGTYEPEFNLLEGVTGVGLVFLSYLTSDFDWDYCLMLND